MKMVFVFLTLTTFSHLAFAKTTLDCNGHETTLSLDLKASTFFFFQFCWNPCNSGEGRLLGTSSEGEKTTYLLEQTGGELIEPTHAPITTLVLGKDGRGTLRTLDSKETLELTCEFTEVPDP